MSVRLDGDTVYLEAQCRVEDAEPLSTHLQAGAQRVDVSGCELLHAAVFQALIAFKPVIVGTEPDTTVSKWLATLPARAEN